MIIELIAAAIAGYVVYRQESIEKSIRELRDDVIRLESHLPRRRTDPPELLDLDRFSP